MIKCEKISPESRKTVAVQAISYIFKSFQIFHNEVLIGSLIQEILETLVEEVETFEVVFEAFWPLIFQVFLCLLVILDLEFKSRPLKTSKDILIQKRRSSDHSLNQPIFH